jgi:hypothetical protein
MCQGLPCIGARVTLGQAVRVAGRLIPAGSSGVVEEEDLEKRSVLVFFSELDIRASVPEAYLSEEDEEGMTTMSET